MHSITFCNTNSESGINQIIPILLSKTSDPCTFSSKMGAPHCNDLNECIGEEVGCLRAQIIVAKQPIEFLNYPNFNPKSDL